MNLPFKIFLISLLVIAIPTVAICAQDGFTTNGMLFIYGFFAIIGGAINLLVALILAIAGNKKPGLLQGFLISGLFFLITGFFSLTQVAFSR